MQSADLLKLSDLLPVIQPYKYFQVKSGITHNEVKNFDFHQSNFAQLGSKALLSTLVDKLIPVDISNELELLHSRDYLEVTFPVLGIADLLTSTLTSKSADLGKVLSINGNCGLQALLPDHIVAIDIVGNKYEILIDHEGNITLPEEGTGLFSILSAVTFMFHRSQVLEGNGLESGEDIGLEKGFIYILPPSVFHDVYSANITVSFLNEQNQRIVSSLRSIEFEPEFQNAHEVHPQSLTNLLNQSYTKIDLQKDFIQGDHFGLKFDDGYNNFILRNEGYIFFHEKFIEGVVNFQIDPSELFSRVENDYFDGLDFDHIAVNSIDRSYFEKMYDEHGFHLDSLKNLLQESFSESNSLTEHFYTQELVLDFDPRAIETMTTQSNHDQINTISFYDDSYQALAEVQSPSLKENEIFISPEAGFSPLMSTEVFSSQFSVESLESFKNTDFSKVDLNVLLPEASIAPHDHVNVDQPINLSEFQYNQSITTTSPLDHIPVMVIQSNNTEI